MAPPPSAFALGYLLSRLRRWIFAEVAIADECRSSLPPGATQNPAV